MKNKALYIALLGILLLASCQREKKVEPVTEAPKSEPVESVIHRLPEYHFSDTVRVGQRIYAYTLHREASDSLGSVCDEYGDHYVNNFYTLEVRQGGTSIYSKRFTKQTLASRLSADFLKNGILDGFRFFRVQEGKLVFSLCVSYPESDLSAPFLLTIAPDGSSTLVEDEYMDVEPDDAP